MKKKFTLILSLVLIVATLLLAGCYSENQHEGVKVVFMLEGAKFQNGEDTVVQYYNFEKGTQNLIKPLQEFAEKGDFLNPGFDFDGWYCTKNEDGTYSDLWNFNTDTVDDNGVTLYAKWVKQTLYSYKVYDFDTRQLVSTKTVNENTSFRNTYATRSGYTVLEVYDEQGEVWGTNSPTPSGETLEVNVYVKYIQGSYSIVKTASELKLAVSGNSNIYLADDIDLEGALFNFGDFRKEFVGNNHTISNFSLVYGSGYGGAVMRDDLIEDFEDNSKKSLSIALFGCTNGANIHDVTIENFTVKIDTSFSGIYKIYFAPIATKAVDTTIANVTVKGSVSVVKLPDSIVEDRSKLILDLDNPYLADFANNNTVSEFVSELTMIENNSEE